jgi:hypothetical protein
MSVAEYGVKKNYDYGKNQRYEGPEAIAALAVGSGCQIRKMSPEAIVRNYGPNDEECEWEVCYEDIHTEPPPQAAALALTELLAQRQGLMLV